MMSELFVRNEMGWLQRIILLQLALMTLHIVRSVTVQENIQLRRTDEEMEEIKARMFKDDVNQTESEYGDLFIMQHRGGERNAKKLGKKFGFIYKETMCDDFYIFYKDGVPQRSKYKHVFPVAAMYNQDKKLVSMIQTQNERLGLHLETSTHEERNARSVTNEELEDEWYFRENASMGVYEAWQRGYSGKGIVISLIADGVQKDHPDLVKNFNVSLSYDYLLDIPGGFAVEATDIGGTSLAGLMAAERNDICVTGLAYEAHFASLRFTSENLYFSDYTIAQTMTHRLDVIDVHSKAWSYIRDGTSYKTFTTLEKSAIEKGIREGRDGKGVIYVTGTLLNNYDEDCNTDPFSSSIHIITVNGVRADGSILHAAEQCTSVMVSAFAGSFGAGTGGLMSASTGDGCRLIDGSAVASVIVSAAIALALEANYELTYRDVQHLLVETASPDVISGTDFTINGAGKKVSPAVGFGLVNVSALVEAAETWKTVPDIISCDGPLQTVDICCEDELMANFTVDACHINYVEHVEVYVYFKTTWREYTEIHLISPHGTDNRLLRQRPLDHVVRDLEFTFTSLQNWGEDPRGNWTIMLKNFYLCENVMYLYSWSLKIFGTVTDPHLGKPENGTLGGHYSDFSPCQNGTYPLEGSNICINCNIAGYRIVDNICAKDGEVGGYCDTNITCSDAYLCNNSKCNECPDGFHGFMQICIEDGTLGGYCDGNILCDLDPPNLGCNKTSLRCVNCTNGWRTIDGLCQQDGKFHGYCDDEIICDEVVIINYVEQNFGCVTAVNRCDLCDIYTYHSLVDGVCIKDGIIGGICNPYIPCTVAGSGCNISTSLCVDCNMEEFRRWYGYCTKDAVWDGYCDEDLLCTDGTSCNTVTHTCVACDKSGYHDLEGFCMKDGYLSGYCSDQVPCVTDNAACLQSTNVCVNCLKPNYVRNGYCFIVDETSDNDAAGSDAGQLVGIGTGAVALGVMSTMAGFVFLVKKFMITRIQPGTSDVKVSKKE